jgi:trimethylamine---corrinoid protein Co-methyltransferase
MIPVEMRAAGNPFLVLKEDEVTRIHQGALRILAEMGMEIKNQYLLDILAASGLPVDAEEQRVRFPSPWVESWIADCERIDWDNIVPGITASAGVYFSRYHDPDTRQLLPWTEPRLVRYFSLARQLGNIGSATLLGNRLEGNGNLEPLYERYYAWKLGANEGGSILHDELCPALLEMYEVAADHRMAAVDEIFHATVYLVPALRLGAHEAYQVAYFLERGLRVGIGGSMMSMGANAPVTLAGAVTLNLAEQIALGILRWAFYGDQHLSISTSIAPMDMRTLIRPFGRPESPLANLMTAQLARFYGAGFSGHAALTDAKLPGAEAGYQKAFSALPTLMAGGSLWMDAGLLAIDEVCSPIQMVLDNEFLGALKHFSQEYTIDDETIGMETILQVGPGGIYAAETHTVKHFRKELWQPALWSREMLAVWLEKGAKPDVDKAAEMALSLPVQRVQFSEAFDRDLMGVIEAAQKLLLR